MADSIIPARSAREEAAASQARAADPEASAWVGASAGSGKTKLLTDRVLRLLLAGVAPTRILCLTFTRAAAAEMATRLARELGKWAVAEQGALAAALQGLTGRAPVPEEIQRARALFALVLEVPGGMRIATLHAFCQTVLRGFPLEAGLSPQFSVLEDRDQSSLLAEAREAALSAEGTIAERRILAGLLGADRFAEVANKLLQNRDQVEDSIRSRGGLPFLDAALAEALEVPEGGEAALLEEFCAIPGAVLEAARALAEHKNKTSRDAAQKMLAFLGRPPEERPAHWEEWRAALLTNDGGLRKAVAASEACAQEGDRIIGLLGRMAAARLHDATRTLLALGLPMLDRYAARKRQAGLLDYNDLIAAARRLLRNPGSAWVLFKLDGGLDHVLVDEAQDSNPEQWGIVSALTEDFFSGEGAEHPGPVPRSVFAVGDAKQSIYGFQGADAEGFLRWRGRFAERAGAAGVDFRQVPLNVSFRSTAPVLALVDAVFAASPASWGVVTDGTLHHRPDRAGAAGLVELWPLLEPQPTAQPEAHALPAVLDATGPEALLARALAARIHAMLGETLPARIEAGQPSAAGRLIRPGDILVLVRRRTAFVRHLVRALKEAQVPVGGVDRLALVEQIAVQDVLALCDVLLLPGDDLQLAALLKSPLIGLDDTALFALAHGRSGSLWAALQARRGEGSPEGRAATFIATLMARADYTPPHALLAEVLTERGGRARLLARLGADAADPLDELLNAALSYERSHPPSLQGFLHWLRQGGAEVKRETEAGADQVRIMTVHGAKGLQAPVVILPDTVGGGRDDPGLHWMAGPPHERPLADEPGTELPLWAPRQDGYAEAPALAQAMEARRSRQEAEQHRLLYVALTRAEDRLLICGWQTAKAPPDDCWYRLIESGFRRLEAEEAPFAPASFGAAPESFAATTLLRFATPQSAPQQEEAASHRAQAAALPSWFGQPVPEEPRSRVVHPSALAGESAGPAAPPPRAAADPTGARFRRGRLLHALLQYLPDLPPDTWQAAAARFLERRALEQEETATLLAEAMALLQHPDLAAAFGPASRAEVPMAGRIGGLLVTGQVDRLLVTPDEVLVVDFKTNRPPPRQVADVPPLYLRQMSAYRALLREAFPGRPVHCTLVWTYGARLMPLPDTLLDQHAPGAFSAAINATINATGP